MKKVSVLIFLSLIFVYSNSTLASNVNSSKPKENKHENKNNKLENKKSNKNKHLFGYSEFSFSYFNWINPDQKIDDYTFFKVDGAIEFTKFYAQGNLGIANLINITDSSKDFGIYAQGSAAYKIFNSNLGLYAQADNYSINNTYQQNIAFGLNYFYRNKKFWFMPYTAPSFYNDQENTIYNGILLGWNLRSNFTFLNRTAHLTSWHETNFAMNEDIFYSNTSQNGEIGVWIDVFNRINLGTQYRYFNNKYYAKDFNHSMVFSIKYQF